ncbi:hypothetical protein RB195_010480 [Necator americanus]
MSNGRKVRRLVNLLIPLEVRDSHQADTTTARIPENHAGSSSDADGRQNVRYNLQPRREKENHSAIVNFTRSGAATVMLLMTFFFLPEIAKAGFQMNYSHGAKGTIRYMRGGAQLTSNLRKRALSSEEQPERERDSSIKG